MIAIGTWSLLPTDSRWPYGKVARAEAINIISYAFRSPEIFLIDSSISYGNTKTNLLLGSVFQRMTNITSSYQKIVVSKIGRATFDIVKLVHDLDKIKEQIEESLTLKCFNSIAIHDADLFSSEYRNKIAKLLNRMKEDGYIRTWGISLARPSPSPLVQLDFKPDYVQFNFNVLDHRALTTGLIELCARERLTSLARTVFAGGLLAVSTSKRVALYNLKRTPESMRKTIDSFCDRPAIKNYGSLLELCLNFVFSHNLTPLVGVTTQKQLDKLIDLSVPQRTPIPGSIISSAAEIAQSIDRSMI
jgi:aryl-alcohol dehydrogenase-like predicted oxidoreductase